jgi:PAS domain S-box-containing protein
VLGALLANLWVGEPIATASAIAAGNTLEALTAGWLLARVGFLPALARLRDALALVALAAGASTTVSASIGTVALCASGLHPWDAAGMLWRTWWVGDALGALLVCPLVLVWAAAAAPPSVAERRVEAAGLVVVAVAVVLAVFALPAAPPLASYPHEYLIFPVVIWAALRFGQRGTATVGFLVAAVAIASTVRGVGPFIAETPHLSLLLLQLFMAIVATTGLLLAAAIGERDAARRQVRDDLARERASDERLRLALNAGRMGVWDWDLHTGEVRWSEGMEAIFGIAPGRFAGTIDSFFALVHSDDQPLISDALERTLRDGTPYQVEFRNLRDDGAIGWMAATGRVFLDARGRPARILGVGMDITVRRQLAGELEARAAELAEADRRKDEFLAMLAHELRNPLAPLRTAISLLRLDARRADQSLDIADRQVDQLARLVDDLLDVSRITQGRITLHREPVAIAAVVASALETVRPAADARGHVLRVSLPTKPVRVDADPARLAQVLANLLDNAVKYTPPGGAVWLTAEQVGERVVLRVRDTGAGIAPEVLPQVFDLFVQADRTLDRARGGLGIGLTIVRRLVELHGGRVDARSPGLGLGSEFVVELPALPASLDDGRLETVTLAGSRSAGSSLRVLVVEDNQDTAESLAAMIEVWGHEVRVAFDGPTALDLSEHWTPDVIISDLGLPGVDGYELACRLRSRPRLGGAVLIALSGYGREEDKRRALDAGFDHHLTKPPDLNALANLLGGMATPASERGSHRMH